MNDMLTTLICVLFFQADPIRPFETHAMVNAAEVRAVDEQQRRSVVQAQQAFEDKFNRLIDALQEFTKKYNGSQGQVWPAKEASALKAALKEVERAVPNQKQSPPRKTVR